MIALLCALGAVAATLMPSVVRADAAADAETRDLVTGAVDALNAGRPADAIDRFEALADRGVVDANMSLDRGLAYALRVKLSADAPGDLGRAAHGFEEARQLAANGDPKLAESAANAVGIVRAEVARRRARAGDTPSLEPGTSLALTAAHLLPENAWAGLAIAGSLLFALGLFVRGLADAQARRWRIGGSICAAIAAPLLLLSGGLDLVSRNERLYLDEGIVVVSTARLTDDAHRPLDGAPLVPEAARVQIVDARAGWARVKWGALDGWVSATAVRPIAKAP